MFRIEHTSEPVLPWPRFVRRLGLSLSVGAGLIAGSLGVGMAGYHTLEGWGWLDAFLNAAMLLSGMGPLAPPQTVAGKLFAGLYALYSGFAVLVIAGAMLFRRSGKKVEIPLPAQNQVTGDK